MQVVFVLGTSTGGTARHVRTLAARAAARGVTVEVFRPRADRPRLRLRRQRRRRASSGSDRGPPARTPRPAGDPAVASVARRAAAHVAHAVWPAGLARSPPSRWRLSGPPVYHPRPALVVTVHNAPPAGGATGSGDPRARADRRAQRRLGALRVAGSRGTHARRGCPLGRPRRGPRGRSCWTLPPRAFPRKRPPPCPCPGTRLRDVPLNSGGRKAGGAEGIRHLAGGRGPVAGHPAQAALVIAGEGPTRRRPEGPGRPPRARRQVRLGIATTCRPCPCCGRRVRAAQRVGRPAPHPAGGARAGRPSWPPGSAACWCSPGEDAAGAVPPGDARRLADGVRAVIHQVLAARLRKAAASRGHALPARTTPWPPPWPNTTT